MTKLFSALLTVLVASTATSAPKVEFLPQNHFDDQINYTASILAKKPNPGITELSMYLMQGDYVVAKESLKKVKTAVSAFSKNEGTEYYAASIHFRVNLKSVRKSIKSIIDKVGNDSRGGTFHFVLTHISTESSMPNMPLLRPFVLDVEDFTDRLDNRVTAKPYLSTFSLYTGGDRQLDPNDPKTSNILASYHIEFFRTKMKGLFPSAVGEDSFQSRKEEVVEEEYHF